MHETVSFLQSFELQINLSLIPFQVEVIQLCFVSSQSCQVSDMLADLLDFFDNISLGDNEGLVFVELRLVQLLLLLSLFILFNSNRFL